METSETFERLVRSEFAPKKTYLNTASNGLLPARTVAALHEAALMRAEGRPLGSLHDDVEAARAAFARLAGVPVERVAAGASVAAHTGVVAASLPSGAEVLTAEDDFTSVVTPFHVRGDLKVRAVPLERLAESVRPGTALVAVSAAQSADGRIADLDAIEEAARTHGARTYVDFSQAAGWLPMTADAYDFTVSITFKWLLGPHGAAFLVVPEDFGGLTPVLAGWVAGESPWDSCYGPVAELAHSARRFDVSPALFTYAGLRHSLALIEELGVDAVRAHDLALAERFRAGLASLGHAPVPAPGSAIVSVPGLGGKQPELSAAGIEVSNRAGNLRASFHLYNTDADVDRLLDVLSG
ncbi:aminotransferase class V-fold PLP-dependent enzyme [Streptomyces ipomoeae]|jgi:selenocysteine lyase/cysteine desulfurase|uniref:Aminotransferase, class V n=2 Tax=Streptomyces ipomoeae TaxID=103232 RepID=L1KZZ5_9ACTN|nr:aminotransferase class V-fold PLP-dependent enzyme [Streptomyces ipomoeae]EKX66376.1 aminotransferase, class V [Streptomyces ipomoeae 91-03]MDX2698668.1 aminotransferase class V-fold PLP-dependent enzyme [Streptomyces ipomoeae]MDX2844335.1 aminotransferase class V-fold PLP-dependent enzyme [Streptomyces ipomoeae]TQE19398.1 aminotransferase class V-fold PLP-dependent enzyme [Streptomyces ipomoeae]TQE33676.1 aminotransferase class V-fold PLP-dependent enzyme [Streptomyces ipomoeae]